MISDFDLLSHKVDELARLAHALRRENAGLRADLALADAEKNELARRMELAQQRVAALLARLPDALLDQAPFVGAGEGDFHSALPAAFANPEDDISSPPVRKAAA